MCILPVVILSQVSSSAFLVVCPRAGARPKRRGFLPNIENQKSISKIVSSGGRQCSKSLLVRFCALPATLCLCTRLWSLSECMYTSNTVPGIDFWGKWEIFSVYPTVFNGRSATFLGVGGIFLAAMPRNGQFLFKYLWLLCCGMMHSAQYAISIFCAGFCSFDPLSAVHLQSTLSTAHDSVCRILAVGPLSQKYYQTHCSQKIRLFKSQLIIRSDMFVVVAAQHATAYLPVPTQPQPQCPWRWKWKRSWSVPPSWTVFLTCEFCFAVS